MSRLNILTITAILLLVFAMAVLGIILDAKNKQASYWGGVFQTDAYWLTPNNSHLVKVYRTETHLGYFQDYAVNAAGILEKLILVDSDGLTTTVQLPTYKIADARIYNTIQGVLEEGILIENFYTLLDTKNYFALFISNEIGSATKFLTGAYIISN